MTMTFRDETNHPILQKYINVIKELDDDRVMCICYDDVDNSFNITESCDEWYFHKLTKDECIKLSELFKEIAEVIDT